VSPLEIAAAIITAWCIWLATKENVLYWPVGVVSVVLYSYIFYEAKLYADAALQIVYLILTAYGWWQWLRGGESGTVLKVRSTPAKAWLLLFIAGAIGSFILAEVMRRWTDNPAPYIDATTASFSIVAQWMTAKKWLENWLVWIVVDVVYVFLYIKRDLKPTAVLYAVFLVLAVKGFRDWRRSVSA
jgi:nicotinamide mononucleotide transporter